MTPQRVTHPRKTTLLSSDDPSIVPLDVVTADDGARYSFWKPSLGELWKMACGHPVALGVIGAHPPVTVVVGADSVPGFYRVG